MIQMKVGSYVERDEVVTKKTVSVILSITLAWSLCACASGTGTALPTDGSGEAGADSVAEQPEPEEGAAQLHSFTELANGDARCDDCGALRSNIGTGWLVEEVPCFDGGVYSDHIYSAGQGIDDGSFPEEKNSEMMIISETDEAMFLDYCEKLESYGYSREFDNARDGSLFREYVGEFGMIYTYYTAATGDCRVILDRNSTKTPGDFGYTYEKTAEDTTVIYQYGLPQINEIVPYSEELQLFVASDGTKWIDCGMCYILKLADNSAVVIDGGDYHQFDDAQIDGMMSFLREVTDTDENEKVRIAGWFFTHIHEDHMAGFCRFLARYSEELSIERVFCNFPVIDDNKFGGMKTIGKLTDYLAEYAGSDYEFLKVHTGQSFTLADASFDIIYTHEDCVRSKTGATAFGYDTNNTSTVMKISFDGKTFLVLGDINTQARDIISYNNSPETLKSDIVQMGHHTINNLSLLYSKIKAEAVFVPASRATASWSGTRMQTVKDATKYVVNDMVFYSQEGTYGLAVVDGELQQVYYKPVDGGPYEDWFW